MARPFQQCESHPARLLTEHLQDVGARADSAAGGDAWPRILGLFHDVGKGTSYFAKHLAGQRIDGGLSHHAWLGATLLLLSLTTKDQGDNGSRLTDSLEVALAYLGVRGHHTGLMDLVSALETPDQTERKVFEQQFSAIDLPGLNEWLRRQGLNMADVSCLNNSFWQDQHMVVRRLLKQVVSDDEAMHRLQRALLRFGILINADRDSAAQIEPDRFERPFRLTSEHLSAFRSSVNFGHSGPLMQSIRERLFFAAQGTAVQPPAEQGRLWTLTAPTGSGKTLAALGWALRRREARTEAGRPVGPIIYALPFTSIIDQNAAVIRAIIQGAASENATEGALAEHHHLADFGATESESSPIARLWAEGWRADIVCTSFVQIVQALFHGTPADARRFSRLAGATVILDEVQTVPVEYWPLLRTSLRSLCRNFGTDILLATATQPAIFGNEDDVTELAPSPLVKPNEPSFNRYDVQFETDVRLSLPQFADRVAREITLSNTTSALIVVNTIREALDLFQLLRQEEAFPRLAGYRLFHLSTNLRPKDRRQCLADLATTSEPRLVVSTQVIEAGVDLSFDVVFRVNAPIDSIVQAAGRCNRHGQGPRGMVYVVELEGETNKCIYGAIHMDVARRVTKKLLRREISEPEIRDVVDAYFKTLAADKSQEKSTKVMEAVRQLEFGSLRGLNDRDKAVILIEELAYRVPHFIETDAEDWGVWKAFINALAIADTATRRRTLHRLRPHVATRVVEVPRAFAREPDPDPKTGLVHVARADISRFYDPVTGWIRDVGQRQELGRTEIIV